MKFHVQRQTEIARPPVDVYRFIATDHARSHPRWDAWLVDFKQLDSGPIAVGTRFAYKRKAFGPMTQMMQLVVTEMEPGVRFAFDLKSSTTTTITYRLQPSQVGTRVDFDGRFEAPGPQFMAGLVKGTVDRQVTDGQRRIKQLVESGG